MATRGLKFTTEIPLKKKKNRVEIGLSREETDLRDTECQDFPSTINQREEMIILSSREPKLKEYLDRRTWRRNTAKLFTLTNSNGTRNGSNSLAKKSGITHLKLSKEESPAPKIISKQSIIGEDNSEIKRSRRMIKSKSKSLNILEPREKSLICNDIDMVIFKEQEEIMEIVEIEESMKKRKERRKTIRKSFMRGRSILKKKGGGRIKSQKKVQFRNYNTIMKFNPNNDVEELEHRIKKKKFTKVIFRA